MSLEPLLLKQKLVIVGAGPVGCLSAISFAKHGWDVEIYEARSDIRLPSSRPGAAMQQRSINLAVSSRGIAALACVDSDVANRILSTAIPLRGRMIHHQGKLVQHMYDIDGQCIYSMDRSVLNGALLDETHPFPNIHTYFDHKVQSVDFDARTMTVHDVKDGKDIRIKFDFCIGADGSYSIVRSQMMRVVRMDYQQQYIPHEYIELKMPSGRDGAGNPSFLLDPSYLHIWPRHSFMLIALPNKDKTFTCTLFAPKAEFDRLATPEMTLAWFKSYFPDALALTGETALLEVFKRNIRSPLISNRMKPYHYQDRVILLGDAAHSMVPFYGQGLNCGLEDVRILQNLFLEEGVKSPVESGQLNLFHQRLARALQRYTDNRNQDLLAICDLAMAHFVEMRHSVTTPMFLLGKALDNLLYRLNPRRNISLTSMLPVLTHVTFPPGEPRGWVPLYTMVTFRPDISYATATSVATRQSRIVGAVVTAGVAATVLGALWLIGLLRTEGRG